MVRRFIPDSLAFAAAASAFMTVMAAAGAPSTLLVVYQEEWHFEDSMLTIAFSVYALTLLVSLLLAGSLSDGIGRRPVLLAALGIQTLSMVVFLWAPDIKSVILARSIQGAATGIAISTFSAYVIEIAPEGRKRLGELLSSIASVGGLGIGAILTGLAVQYAAQPASVVFTVALVIFVGALVLVAFSRETVDLPADRARIVVPRLRVTGAVSRTFSLLSPGLIGIWMSAGLMLGLGASIARNELHLTGGAITGLVVAAQPLAATVSTLLLGPRLAARRLVPLGYLGVLVGVGLEAGSISLYSAPLIIIGAVITGLGFGAAFSGSLGLMVPLARPTERAQLFSVVYLVAYLAYGVPTVAFGFVSDAVGLVGASLWYAAAILIATLIALVRYALASPVSRM